MARQNRNKKSFKKVINRDVTREDQRQARGARFDRLKDAKYSVPSSDNDPEWYAKDPALLRDSASIPFSWPTGIQFTLNGANVAYTQVIPGLCTLELLPCCGLATTENSAVNVAAQALYSFVRHANSGSRNYDNPDLMLYVIAMSNVYSAITWLERVYGQSMLYSMNNRYMPDMLLASQGLAIDGEAGSLAEFRYGINLLINKASAFAVPKSFPIFRRHAFLFQNLYKDGASDKCQLYQYVPYGFMKFGLDEDGAGSLTAVPWDLTGSATYTDLLQYVSNLLSPLLNNEDIGLMSGDILKAFGSEGILTLTTLEENYVVEPIYNIEVLEQFKNARGLAISVLETPTIVQSPSKTYLQFAPMAKPTAQDIINICKLMATDQTITTQLVNPGPETVMVNSRLMEYLSPEATNEWSVVCGTELVGYAHYYRWQYTNNARTIQTFSHSAWASFISGVASVATAVPLISQRAYFDMAPFYGVSQWTTDSASLVGNNVIFDLDNWAVLTRQNLLRLHETATMSELHLEAVAKAYTG